MKKLFTIICLLLLNNIVFAQKTHEAEEAGVVGKASLINMYHNPVDLERLSKDVLVNIYIKRFEAFLELSPFMAFHSDKGKTMSAMGIPSTKDAVKRIDKLLKEKLKFEKHLAGTISQFGGYGEKQQIIDSIIFIEKVLGDIKHRIDTQNKKG